MKCFYHNDSDGKCAGYWVAASAKQTKPQHSAEFIPINYDNHFPFETILPGEQIFIVDFSIPPSDMDKLLAITKDVTFIDHHKSAIEQYKDYPHEIRGIRYDGIAGCMLTYCYLNKMTDRGLGDIKPFNVSMVVDAPLFTKLIADWDVWKFDFGDNTRYFQMAFHSYDFSPESTEWTKLLKNKNEECLINEGRIMHKYRNAWARSYCKSIGFEVEFEGYRCFAINLGLCNSEYFISVCDEGYDILVAFSYNGVNWKYSLYSCTVDVSKIAEKYAGGGHAGAAGFYNDKLLLETQKGGI